LQNLLQANREYNKDKKAEQYKSVPWWTKPLNAEKKAERTQKEVPKDEREYSPKRTLKQYRTVKAEYAQTIKKEIYESWKNILHPHSGE